MLNYYPARVKKHDNTVTLTLVNFPHVHWTGNDTETAAKRLVRILNQAIYTEIQATGEFPAASLPLRGQVMIRVPASAFIKLQIHLMVKRRKLSRLQLCAILDRSDRQVQRILDINYSTRLNELDYAVNKLGGSIGVLVEDHAYTG